MNLVRLQATVESRVGIVSPFSTWHWCDRRAGPDARTALAVSIGTSERDGLDARLTPPASIVVQPGIPGPPALDGAHRVSAERLIQYEAVTRSRDGAISVGAFAATPMLRVCSSRDPGRALIFHRVAMTAGWAARVRPLLDPGESRRSAGDRRCLFYSITNCQEGLRECPRKVSHQAGRRDSRERTFPA